MADAAHSNKSFSLEDFAKFSLLCAGVGGVSGGLVGGVSRYLLGFRQVTPLTGLVTGTVFGGLYPLAAIVSGIVTEIVFGECGLSNGFFLFGGGAVLDFAITPLVAGFVGFPIASYWQFLAQIVAQVVIGFLIFASLE